ncbi:MAG: TetR/AcrR family transcriptional regulator [Bombilactobacillus mellis]|nr:TetR/AcrR family transcriptional regulator [Bombilactobacillus mellis]
MAVLSEYQRQINNKDMPAGKKKVLAAALELFSNNGFHATTTAKIAQLAGVSEGTIYKYFPSKNELLKQLLTPLFLKIKNNFFIKVQNYHNLTELVSFFVEDRVQFVINNFSLFKLFIQEVLIQSPMAEILDNILNNQDGIFSDLQKLKDNFPEINQQLSPLEILRIFLGPMIVYIFQNQLFQAEVENYHQDLELIKRQIIAGLKA